MVNTNKKTKWNHSENEIIPRFIVIESLEKNSFNQTFSFLDGKKWSPAEQTIKLWKKMRSSNLLVEGDNKKTCQKPNQNENFSQLAMQNLPAWKTQHFKGGY